MYELLMSLLTFNPSSYTFYGVTLNHSVQYNGATLALTGFGMGGKKTGPTVAKVAVNQFFTQYPQRFVRTEEGALNSLDNVGLLVMSVSFLRGVDTQSVKTSISDVIRSNINEREMLTYKDDIEKVNDAILTDGTIYSGDTINIVGDSSTGLLLYVNAANKVTPIESEQGFVKKVFSAWFGKTTDQTGYNLKMALLKEPDLKSVK